MSINYKILSISWAILILCLSITPGNYIPQVEFNLIAPDTIAHVLFYLIFVLLFLKWKSFQLIQILIFSILYGSLIEVIQGALIPGRFFDVYDILSNSIGSLLGLVIFKIFTRYS